MFALWGKKNTVDVAGTKSHYYNTNGGQILSADGAGYVLPDLGSIEAEKADYIPRDFATQKVTAIVRDSNSMKESYKEHVDKLNKYYLQALDDSKAHYEGIIIDMRAKAQRHVEINKQMRQQVEERLGRELKVSEDALEELRDDMAKLNREYQDEVRKLKQKLYESEEAVQAQRQTIDAHDTTAMAGMLIADILSEVEAYSVEEQHQLALKNLLEQISSLQMDSERSFQDLQEQHTAARSAAQADHTAREIVREALNDTVTRIEVSEFREHLVHLAGLQGQIEVMNSKCAELAQQLADKESALSAAQRHHSELSTQGDAYAQQIDALERDYAQEKEALVAEHSGAVAALTASQTEAIAILQAQIDDAEVAKVVDHMLMVILSEGLESAEDQVAFHSDQLGRTNAVLEGLKVDHSSKLSSSDKAYQRAVDELNKRYGAKMDALQAANDALEVSAVVGSLVSKVEAAHPQRSVQVVQGAPADLLAQIADLKEQLLKAHETVKVQQEEAKKSGTAHPAQSPVAVAEMTVPMGDQSAAPAVVAPAVPAAPSAELLAARAALAEVVARLADAQSKLTPAQAEREKTKAEIKDWTKDFAAANGREPEVADKAAIKDKYQRYKVSSGQAKEMEQTVAQLTADKAKAEEKVKAIEAQAPKVVQMRPAVAGGAMVSVVDAEVQVTTSELRRQVSSIPQGAVDASKGPVDQTEQLERLEDQLYEAQQAANAAAQQHALLVTEHEFVSNKLEELIKEKRTDIVKRYEEEMERLGQSEKDLTEKVTMLTGERIRLDARVKELTSRAETAESELKERDARELAALSPQEEKTVLKTQINKQRDQIVLKSKAATAGWDAAAKADETVELEVHRAYTKGLKEGKEVTKKDLEGLNKSLEVKEVRITELLVNITNMEKTVKAAKTSEETMRAQMDAMRLEITDAIAAIQAVGGGGGGEEGGASSAELESAREALDSAQEELVGLSERCDRLEGELEMARKKNRIYERLANLTGLHTGTVTMPTAGDKGNENAYDINAVLNNIKKVIVKVSPRFLTSSCADSWSSAQTCGRAIARMNAMISI